MKTHPSDNDEFEHLFGTVIKEKPMKSLDNLFLHLLPHSKKIVLPKNRTYRLNEERDGVGIILIADGIISVVNTESGFYTYSLYHPSIAGLIHGYSKYYQSSWKVKNTLIAETDSVLFFVGLDNFVKVMDENNLWHDVARVLAHRLITMLSKEENFLGADSYSMIRPLILEVWSYPIDYRVQINLPQFIQKRTGLSRSRVMKILQDLKGGNYISLSNGKLTSMSKLPDKY